MKYLGIDYGSKRVGIALSDEDGKMAFPNCVLDNNQNLLAEVEKIIKKENVGSVVMGESKNFNNEPNPIMADILKFKNELSQKTKLEIFLEPEFMTSAEAEHIQGKTLMHDASAAAIILQSYLDKNQPVI